MEQTKTPEQLKKEKRYQARRAWALAHPERVREYGRAFYRRNAERRRAYSREYQRMHKKDSREAARAYYQRKKAEDPLYVWKLNQRAKERRQARVLAGLSPFTPAQRAAQYRYLQEVYTYRSMERIRQEHPEQVAYYLEQYPFDKAVERAVLSALRRYRISPGDAIFADCYDAGMLAYLYSIHRCAAMNYSHVIPYIRKMIRLYVGQARFLSRDLSLLCAENDLRPTYLDSGSLGRRY